MSKHPRIDALDLRSGGRRRNDTQTTAGSGREGNAHHLASPGGRHVRRSGASVQGTLSTWLSHLVDARMAERDRRRVSDRAMDLYHNDAMARGILEGLPIEVVGTGLTPQQQPMLEWLGLDLEWQAAYQERVYDLFELWGLDSRNFADAQGRCSIYMLQALALFAWKLDGIAVFQVLRTPRPGRSPLSLRVLPIDSARLVTPSDRTRQDIYDGVELGPSGEVSAVWIHNPPRHGTFATSPRTDNCTRLPVYDEHTGLQNVLLVCDVRNVAEYRQDSILGPMIKEIRDNNDFVDAALVKALISNLFTVFIENGVGTNQTRHMDWADRVQELEKGTILMGSASEIPHIIQGNDTPGPSYDIMNNSIIGRLGMATGRGPENVSRAYKASYSASQASIENAGKFDDVDRMVLANRFCQPIHDWMQYEGVLRGILPVSSVQKFVDNLHAYTCTEWLSPKLRPIDKLKAARADDVRLGNGTRTWSDVYGEQSQDYRTKLRQWVNEMAYLRDLAEEHGFTLSDLMTLRHGRGTTEATGTEDSTEE